MQAKGFAYEAIRWADRYGQSAERIDAYINLGRCFRFLLDRDSAFLVLGQAAQMSQETGYLPGAMHAANNIGALYLESAELDSARRAFEASLGYAIEIPDPNGQANAMSNLAIIAQYRMTYDTALHYLGQALAAYQQSRDSSGISRTFVNLAFVYDVLAQKDTAIALYFKALSIQEQLGLPQQQAHTLSLIGDLHTEQNLHAAALPFFRRSLDIATRIPDPRTSFRAARRIGACLLILDSLDAAFPYLQQSLVYAQAWDSASVGSSYTQIGDWYARTPANYAQAWGYYEKALPYLMTSGPPELSELYNSMGALAQAQGRRQQALHYYTQALDVGREIDNLELQQRACLGLSALYREMNDAAQALYYTDRYHQIKDSLVNSQSLETINSLRIAYGVEQKEKERILLQSQLTQKELESEQRRMALWAALAGLLVVFSLTYAAYYRQQRRAKERELARLQQIDRLKDEFLANTSHELRTPLNGIIGDSHRSDAAVIADTVNTSSRLEGLTKYYGAHILLSEVSYATLTPDLSQQCRYVGHVQMKGRTKPLGLYECFGGDDPAAARQKEQTLAAFDEALSAFLAGDMKQSLRGFASLATDADPVAARFLAQTRRYIAEGPPHDWTGVEVMAEK
ncbi:MAG: hypothetical protein OHK0039_34800 [Bacteroidia bacterium]